MGSSATAKLAFGIPLQSGTPSFLTEDEDEDFDMDSYIDEALGIPNYGDPARPTYGEVEKLRATFAVALVHHGYEFEECALIVPGTLLTADWGDPLVLDNLPNRPDDSRVNAFIDFCLDKLTEDDYEGDNYTPKWMLFAEYG